MLSISLQRLCDCEYVTEFKDLICFLEMFVTNVEHGNIKYQTKAIINFQKF